MPSPHTAFTHPFHTPLSHTPFTHPQVTLTDDSLFLVRVAHQLVTDGIAAGLTLYDIAVLVARTDEERPSPLEKALEEVRPSPIYPLSSHYLAVH